MAPKQGGGVPWSFTRFPRERELHPYWHGQTMAGWGLCVRLWGLADGGPIPVHGPDWRTSLCQQWGLSGRERPTVRKLLAELHSEGMLSLVEDGVLVTFFVTKRGGATVASETVPSTSGRRRGDIPLVTEGTYPSSLRGHTQCHRGDIPDEGKRAESPDKKSLDRQTEETEETEETQQRRAGAREAAAAAQDRSSDPVIAGQRWLAAVSGIPITDLPPCGAYPAASRDKRAQALQWIGQRRQSERDAVAAAAAADEWATANRRKLGPEHYVQRWQRYLTGPVSEPPRPVSVAALRDEAAEAAETARRAGQALQHVESEPPWDRERADYPARLTEAQKALAEAVSNRDRLRSRIRKAVGE